MKILRMSANQWKIILFLKEYLFKPGSDTQQVMLLLNKEWFSILKKLSSASGQYSTITVQNREKHSKTSKDLGEENTTSKGNTKLITNSVNELPQKLNDLNVTLKEIESRDTSNYSVKSFSEYAFKINILKNKLKTFEASEYFKSSMNELPMVFNDLRMKFSQKSPALQEDKGKWKSRKNVVSDLSVSSRTRYILSSIMEAESENSKIQRLESLVGHFLQYPEGVSTAVKYGAISRLIALREVNKNEKIAEILREALTILGYTDPVPKQGIRILSIDGGGVRGLLVIDMLQKLEELTGSKVCEMFDFICGVSTGSIIACTMGASGKSPQEIADLYRDLSNKIFTQNAFFGARSLIWNHGYYDTELWEKLLKEHVGMTDLIKTTRRKHCPKIAAISTVSKDDNVTPFIFRNYELPYRIKSQYPGSYSHQLWQAARASAAAPTYFEEFRLGEFLHQDGGILVNNPTAVAIHEAKQLWPKSPIQCVVSFGTGRIDPILRTSKKSKKSAVKQTSWKEKFYNIIISATDTEAVHLTLNDLLPPNVYFRFNPYVSELLSMDEYQPEKLATMHKDALMYMRRNEEKFQEAANSLMREKTFYQKINDFVSLKAVMHSN